MYAVIIIYFDWVGVSKLSVVKFQFLAYIDIYACFSLELLVLAERGSDVKGTTTVCTTMQQVQCIKKNTYIYDKSDKPNKLIKVVLINLANGF